LNIIKKLVISNRTQLELMKDETFSTKDKIIQIITEEEEEPHAHKPFMAKVPVKATPIGYEFHQVEISDFDP